MCLGVFLCGLILYGTLCTSWTWVTLSSSRLGRFSAIISSNIFSSPLSLSLSPPSGTPIMQMLVHLMLSQRALKLSPFFFFFCSDSVISTNLSSSFVICFSVSSDLLLIPYSVFYISVIVCSSLWFFLYMFLNSLLRTFNSSLCSSSLFPSSLNIFMIITPWTLYWVDCLSPLYFVLAFYLVPLFGTYFSVASFVLICCFYSYLFGWLVIFPNLGDVAFLEYVLYVPAAHSSLITRAMCSRGAPYEGCLGPSLVACWLLWVVW